MYSKKPNYITSETRTVSVGEINLMAYQVRRYEKKYICSTDVKKMIGKRYLPSPTPK